MYTPKSSALKSSFAYHIGSLIRTPCLSFMLAQIIPPHMFVGFSLCAYFLKLQLYLGRPKLSQLHPPQFVQFLHCILQAFPSRLHLKVSDITALMLVMWLLLPVYSILTLQRLIKYFKMNNSSLYDF